MDLENLDFTCSVKSCTKIIETTSDALCSSHRSNLYKFGEVEPTLSCYGCQEPTPYRPSYEMRMYCEPCEQLLKKFKHLVPVGFHVHKITRIQYIKILVAQDFSCKICKVRPERLVIDHDHSCCPGDRGCPECVRGLLCVSCNLTLGKYEKNRHLLHAFDEYLSETRVFA